MDHVYILCIECEIYKLANCISDQAWIIKSIWVNAEVPILNKEVKNNSKLCILSTLAVNDTE